MENDVNTTDKTDTDTLEIPAGLRGPAPANKALTAKQKAQAAAGVKVTDNKKDKPTRGSTRLLDAEKVIADAGKTDTAPKALRHGVGADVPKKDDTNTTPALKHKPRTGRVDRKVAAKTKTAPKAATKKAAAPKGKAEKEWTAKEIESAANFAKDVKAHAEKNKDRKGWDKVLKWWDLAAVKKLLLGVDTINGAIKRVKTAAGVM